MSGVYDHNTIEEKWQQFWEENKLFQGSATPTDAQKEKLFLLFAFAYPSGAGLHVGHVESKTALDILARFNRMNGKNVFFPVGWDAFGLPAENYAIKTGIPPVETTKSAITTFRRQIKRIGISYDWESEIATCHPEYYKWTQWIFLEMFNKGLAYQKLGAVNWCPSCQTVLANEQVVNGACERCGTEVIQKEMKQWFFKITDYTDELISGLDTVDWPEATKQQQLNWIGKKRGINIHYKIEGTDQEVVCFTTRPDTNFGATFVVVAPEHPFAQKVANGELKLNTTAQEKLGKYIDEAKKKTELQRQQEGRKKTGVFTGFYAINALNSKKMPIWISDFVLAGFGTGAVVGVPGHDVRDFEFAQTMGLEIIRVVIGSDGDNSQITQLSQVQEKNGTMINSDFLNGLDIHDATDKIMERIEYTGDGEIATTYKLRDWLISRQRYWGVPIPIVYDPEGTPHPVKKEHLPWMLPTDVEFKPTGESPLTYSKEFIDRTEKLYGKGWRPEFDTMDTFVDSSWYFLRYVDARNPEVFAKSEQLKYWEPVDFYMIGPEHIVLHLLYSRFFTKFLRDQGYLNFDEPFMKMRHQGMILGPDGKKMSKSKGNVINPDDIIEKFGADTLRMYEMFMGPIEADKPWDISAVAGVYRFLQRVYRLVSDSIEQSSSAKSKSTASIKAEAQEEIVRKLHVTLKKVTSDIPHLKFNTSIAFLMEYVNVLEKTAATAETTLSREDMTIFVKMIAPFAPFMAEELYQQLQGGKGETVSIHTTDWPVFNPELAQAQTITVGVQINGKVRAELEIPASDVGEKETVLNAAKALEAIKPWLTGKEIVKEIYVPGKIISIVVKIG